MPPRKYKKRRKTRKKKQYIPKPVGGFPMSKEVRFRYCEPDITLAGAIGQVTNYTFSANGMYDPNVTGTGHQPMTYDTWMGLYDHYTVTKSSIKVTWVYNNSNEYNPFGFVGILLSDDGGVSSTLSTSEIMEQKLRANKWSSSTALYAYNQKGATVKHSFDATKFFGIPKKSLINDSLYRGSATSNPTEQAYFEIFYGAFSSSTTPTTIRLVVEIEYIATLNELNETNGS